MIEASEISYIMNDPIVEELPRAYLGLSAIGLKCYRKLQHDHYWTYKTSISKQLRRLFNVGHRMEQVIIDDLADIGIYVSDQQESMTGFAGHWKGHCDGVAIAEIDISRKFLVEFKTHNDSSFKALVKNGVLVSKPVHWDQMQAYMGYLELPYSLYVAYNKNDSYYHCEIVTFDQDRFRELEAKQAEVVLATDLLPRIGNNSPTWFECKMCSASDVCHGNKPVERNCRTCKYVDVVDNGKWHCTNPAEVLTQDMQRLGCERYELGDMFK